MSNHEFASGVLQGADHRYIRTNCQDAVRIFRKTFDDNTVVVGVCADGCGTGEHTEVGAQLGVNIATDVISTEYLASATLGTEVDWSTIKDDIVTRIGNVAQSVWSVNQDYNALIIEYFFFTIIGFVMTEEETIFFRAGDGVLIVNGEDIPIPTPEGNRPEYLGYNLVSSSIRPNIEIMLRLPTAEVDHFLLGSDGLKDIRAAEEKLIPKKQVGSRIPKEELVGPLSQFWTGDQYFDDKEAVRRRIMVFNGGLCAEPRAGIARDDASLIVCRRRSVAL
jgi:hypothetical protein